MLIWDVLPLLSTTSILMMQPKYASLLRDYPLVARKLVDDMLERGVIEQAQGP